MALGAITHQRPAAALRPGGGRASRRLGRVLAQAGKSEDLDRTRSLRELMAKPGVLLVGFGGPALLRASGGPCIQPVVYSSSIIRVVGADKAGGVAPPCRCRLPPPANACCLHSPACQGPCCHDGLSARLIERAGFDFAFMSGFCTAAARLGAPDTGV